MPLSTSRIRFLAKARFITEEAVILRITLRTVCSISVSFIWNPSFFFRPERLVHLGNDFLYDRRDRRLIHVAALVVAVASEIVLISRHVGVIRAAASAAVVTVVAVFVQADVCRMLSGHAEFPTDLVEFLDVFLVKLLGAAQHLGLVEKLRVEPHASILW